MSDHQEHDAKRAADHVENVLNDYRQALQRDAYKISMHLPTTVIALCHADLAKQHTGKLQPAHSVRLEPNECATGLQIPGPCGDS